MWATRWTAVAGLAIASGFLLTGCGALQSAGQAAPTTAQSPATQAVAANNNAANNNAAQNPPPTAPNTQHYHSAHWGYSFDFPASFTAFSRGTTDESDPEFSPDGGKVLLMGGAGKNSVIVTAHCVYSIQWQYPASLKSTVDPEVTANEASFEPGPN